MVQCLPFFMLKLVQFACFFCFCKSRSPCRKKRNFQNVFAETTILIVLSAKHAKLKTHQKDKKTLFVSTPVLTALVKMSVFLYFSFWGFSEFPVFRETFLDRQPKIKK